MTFNWRKIFSAIGIFIFGAIIGGLIGSYASSYFLGSFFSYGSNLTNIVAIKQNVHALSKFREGKIDKAIEHLEIILDGNLITYSVGIRGSEKMKKDIRTALKTAKEYRSKFPRTTSYPEIDKAVAAALAEADN